MNLDIHPPQQPDFGPLFPVPAERGSPVRQPSGSAPTGSAVPALSAPAGSVAPAFLRPNLGIASARSTFQAVIDRYNPTRVELSTSPSPEMFARNAVARNTAIAPVPVPKVRALTTTGLLATTGGTSQAMMAELQEEFAAALRDRRFLWARNNSAVPTRFTADEVSTITNLIFKTTFGRTGFRRARNLVVSYRESNASDVPISSTVLAANLAHDQQLPAEFRQFYRTYADCTRNMVSATPVRQLVILHDKYQVYNEYLRLTTESTVHLEEFLGAAGYVTGQGRGWASVIHSYLAHSLNLSPVKLRNILQDCQTIHLMVTTFGLGVLVFVPASITGA